MATNFFFPNEWIIFFLANGLDQINKTELKGKKIGESHVNLDHKTKYHSTIYHSIFEAIANNMGQNDWFYFYAKNH